MPDTINEDISTDEEVSSRDKSLATVMSVEIVESDCAPDACDGRGSARANAIDRHVGTRIRERRVMLGFSQQQLAHLIGVTYQQAHKYERGLNRISAGRLYEIAQVLNVEVSWFFEGLTTERALDTLTPRQRMCLELARNFAAIHNERHQEALSQMARALAQAA